MPAKTVFVYYIKKHKRSGGGFHIYIYITMARVLFNIHVTETERIPDIDIFLMKISTFMV